MFGTLGVSWIPADLRNYGAVVRQFERVGFNLIAVPDTQASVFRELYVAMTVAATATKRARVAAMVTNPLTRHPAVTAAGMASLRELAGTDRIVVGIGSGATSARHLGLEPAALSQLRTYISDIRTLWSGRQLTGNGYRGHIIWSHHLIPMYLAASGPRSILLAAEIADGMVLNGDLNTDRLEWIGRQLEGAAASGKKDRSASFEILQQFPISIGANRTDAISRALPALAAVAYGLGRRRTDDEFLSTSVREKLKHLHADYAVAYHNDFSRGNPNANLLVKLGLVDAIAGRYAIVGDPTDCARQLRRVRELGVHDVVLRPVTADPREFLTYWKAVAVIANGGPLKPMRNLR